MSRKYIRKLNILLNDKIMKNKLRKWFEKYRVFCVFKHKIEYAGYLQIYTDKYGIERHRWWTIIPYIMVGMDRHYKKFKIILCCLCYFITITIQKQ